MTYAADSQTSIYRVLVRHNLVITLEASGAGEAPIPKTKLEVASQLAENYRVHGCIDGQYLFENSQRAKIFATLCLEFVLALVKQRLDVVNALATGAEYRAPEFSCAERA